MSFLGEALSWLSFLNPGTGAANLYLSGAPFFLTLGFALGYASLGSLVTYYLWGNVVAAAKWLACLWIARRRDRKGEYKARKEIVVFGRFCNNVRTRHHSVQQSLVLWIARKSLLIIFGFLCIPFIPFVPSAAIVALKNVAGEGIQKHLILFSTNILRSTLMVIGIYWLGMFI